MGFKRSRVQISPARFSGDADGISLAEGLGDLKKVDPSNRAVTLAMLLEKYESARTEIADSTRVGETGRIAKFRELFPRSMETLVRTCSFAD